MATFAGIKLVQRGTVLRTSDVETSFVQTIANVDTTKTFITHASARDTANNAVTGSATYLKPLKITSPTQLTFYFTFIATDRTFEYEITEFN